MPRALLSVFDKTGVVDFARALHDLGWELLSSGGTATVIADAGIPVIDVATVTGYPAILGHRVVTLHPSIHGALLADTDNAEHVADMHTHNIEPIVLAGFMRVLSNSFLSQFTNQVINIHPALPGELPGTHAIERAFTEFTNSSRRETGVMVHFVPDEGVDNGLVIAQQVVPIHAADTLVTLEARMHATEYALVIDALQQLITQQKAPTL